MKKGLVFDSNLFVENQVSPTWVDSGMIDFAFCPGVCLVSPLGVLWLFLKCHVSFSR